MEQTHFPAYPSDLFGEEKLGLLAQSIAMHAATADGKRNGF